jgi:hypothetical protein
MSPDEQCQSAESDEIDTDWTVNSPDIVHQAGRLFVELPWTDLPCSEVEKDPGGEEA